MTEKNYGGASDFGIKNKPIKKQSKKFIDKTQKNNTKIPSDSKAENLNSPQENKEIEKIKKAGQVASKVRDYAKTFIKPNMPLLEIAEEIEAKILSLNAKPAFPVTLCINEIAAHSTPSYNSQEKASGLLKVDFGVHIDGFIADTAFTIDFSENQEESKENSSLIQAAESALKKAAEIAKLNSQVSKIGEEISKTIESFNFSPIRNLSGHSIKEYSLHSGITIPNFNNTSQLKLSEGLYAIEPFATLSSASGLVREGKLSGIYHLEKIGPVRDTKAREVLQFIIDEYQTLPFCSRWIYKKFGARGLISLKQIESSGLLHHYPQLIESSGKKVAQAEHTILITKNEMIVTTK